MKNLKLLSSMLALSIALFSCTGDDGEPGPQGDVGATGATGATGAAGEGFQKTGSFSGTVSGKRTDGTAFSEAFKYEYGSTTQGFETVNGVKTLDIYRYNKADNYEAEIEISDLELSGNSLIVNPDETSLYFKFIKELNATDLFALNARPYFKDQVGYVTEISETQNASYNFPRSPDGTIYYGTSSYYDQVAGDYIDAYYFNLYSSDGNNIGNAYYRQDNGAFGAIYDHSLDDYVYSGNLFNLYNKLTFKFDASKSILAFFDKATNTSLAATVPAVPADVFTVTNYAQDATTGVVSFDYVLKISQYRPRTGYSVGSNSTGNDLTITGSFNSGGKVYKNIVSRTASGG